MIAVSSSTSQTRNIVILGGGTAGLLSALAFHQHLPFANVTLVRSTRLGVSGVGEGTIISIIHFLHRYLGIDSQRFHQEVRPSIKLGIKYLWGPRSFFHYTFSPQLSAQTSDLELPRGYFCEEEFDFADLTSALMTRNKVCTRRIDGRPKFASSISYHLENQSFVSFLEQLADERGITKIDDELESVAINKNGVQSLRLNSGQEIGGDFFVDCSGFRAELVGKIFQERRTSFQDTLLCDKAIVGGWPRNGETYHPYTTAETMNAGWCWQIEHDETINRGYVFSSDFLTDDQAEQEFRLKNPRAKETRVIHFPAGKFARTWIKNVVAIGNSAGFVEPLEATAIGMICDSIAHVINAFKSSDGHLEQVQIDIFNRVVNENWEIIRDFLALHYKFNTRLETPFWRAAQNDIDLRTATEIVDYYQAVGPDFSYLNYDLKRNFFSAEGYFALLVGQKVPYRRRPEISPAQAKRWKQYKVSLAKKSEKGMDMPEVLSSLRQHGLPGLADRSTDTMERSGDLKWG